MTAKPPTLLQLWSAGVTFLVFFGLLALLWFGPPACCDRRPAAKPSDITGIWRGWTQCENFRGEVEWIVHQNGTNVTVGVRIGMTPSFSTTTVPELQHTMIGRYDQTAGRLIVHDDRARRTLTLRFVVDTKDDNRIIMVTSYRDPAGRVTLTLKRLGTAEDMEMLHL